ncbi:hypothetical protein ABZ387_31730 [Streptomyces flaveolus]
MTTVTETAPANDASGPGRTGERQTLIEWWAERRDDKAESRALLA